jgi:hypothetical protein
LADGDLDRIASGPKPDYGRTMTGTESINSIAELAATLQPAERLEAIERILGSMELSHPSLADLYERVADLEAADVAWAVDQGEQEVHDLGEVLTSLRRHYAG